MKSFDKRKGYALIGAMMFLLLVTIMWLSVTRLMAANLRMEKHLKAQKEYYDGSIRALSWGLTLCQTGRPTGVTTSTSKSWKVRVGADGLQTYVIKYERIPPTSMGFWPVYNYRVTTRPATGADAALPWAPTHF